MNTLNLYPFCEALTSGLLHSLWLFPLLAGLDWLLTRALPQSRHRYLSHLLTLLACLVVFVGMVGRRWWSLTDRYWQATFMEAELGSPLTVQLTDGKCPINGVRWLPPPLGAGGLEPADTV